MTLFATLRARAGAFTGHSDSLRGRVARSISWVGLGYAAEMVLRLGSSLILTRLLSPAAFGIMATAQVFLYTAVMLSDVGIRSLVITHERADDPVFLRTVWTFQIVRGVVLALIVAVLGQGLGFAQTLAWLAPENSFSEPILPAVIAVLGVTLAFSGLKSTNEHIMARDLRQDVLVKLETITKLLSTFITVIAVWLTRSVWGFVYAALLVSILRSALSVIVVPGAKMGLQWNGDDVRYMINRGKWIGVSSWTTLAGSLADKVLIGAFFGSSVLGLYTLALTLADALHSFMTQITNALALPTIRELLNRSHIEFTQKLQSLRSVIQIGSSIVGILLICIAQFIVQTLYDDRYLLAGPLLAVISIKYVIFHLSINCYVLEARREFALLAKFNLARAFSLWILGLFLADQGILVLAIALFSLNHLVERTLASIWLVREGLLNRIQEIRSYAVTVLLILSAAIWLSTNS